ncbi:MAG TPA: NUDIX hydrolase [Vitreimonas sp.]|nr:NUDIX hydrolase [Vitreimonas sp.]
MPDLSTRVFHNANQEVVPYDGSPLSWRVSAYAVIVKNGQLLIIKNRKEKMFDIVGGGIEIGESIDEALTREAREEAGAHIRKGDLLDAHLDWFKHANGHYYQTLQLFYMAELEGELITATDPDIERVIFVPFTELKLYEFPPFVTKVINHLT